MDIGMTIGATRTNVGKYHLCVAVRTGHPFMEAAQGKPGLVMVEFRDGADRLPTVHRVAVLAGLVQATVGTARSLGARKQGWTRQAQGQPETPHDPLRHSHRKQVFPCLVQKCLRIN